MNSSDSLGEFEQSVLLAIAHLGTDTYGVPIRAFLEERLGRAVAIGALYTALERLERKGCVTSRMSEPLPERGGRSRRQFRLRPEGAAALKRSREVMNRLWDGLDPSLKPERR
jgi:DNA-binding PadR family transcriptional regulator